MLMKKAAERAILLVIPHADSIIGQVNSSLIATFAAGEEITPTYAAVAKHYLSVCRPERYCRHLPSRPCPANIPRPLRCQRFHVIAPRDVFPSPYAHARRLTPRAMLTRVFLFTHLARLIGDQDYCSTTTISPTRSHAMRGILFRGGAALPRLRHASYYARCLFSSPSNACRCCPRYYVTLSPRCLRCSDTPLMLLSLFCYLLDACRCFSTAIFAQARGMLCRCCRMMRACRRHIAQSCQQRLQCCPTPTCCWRDNAGASSSLLSDIYSFAADAPRAAMSAPA